MKSAFVLFVMVVFLALLVLAAVFRNRAARDMLRWLRNLAYVWIIVVVVLAFFELRRRGL